MGEKKVIDDLLKTEKYFKLLESLVKNYGKVENDPKLFIYSDTPFYNTVTSYRQWRKYDIDGKGRKLCREWRDLILKPLNFSNSNI